jgi:ssDNA-binding replication factor A large subunit
MNISELKPGQGNVDLEGDVVEKGDVREFDKFGRKLKVCNVKIKDSTGIIILALWNEQIEQVNVDDIIAIKNGYVSEFKGEMQLSLGRMGSVEIKGKKERTQSAATEDSKNNENKYDEEYLDVEEEKVE